MYTINATKFTQNGRVFYLAAIPAGDLISMTQVDVWSDEKPDTGYQRAPERTRLRKIAKYAKLLGFGEVTGIDINGEAKGLVPTKIWKWEVSSKAPTIKTANL